MQDVVDAISGKPPEGYAALVEASIERTAASAGLPEPLQCRRIEGPLPRLDPPPAAG
jgi:hypothetical protein